MGRDDGGGGSPLGAPARSKPTFRAELDLEVTVVLTGVQALLAALLLVFGRFTAMQADPCGTPGYRCDTGVVDGAAAAASLLPVVLLLLAVVAAFRQHRRGRLAFPVPLLGIALTLAVLALATLAARSAVLAPG